MTNPWKLTPRERDVCEHLIVLVEDKLISRALEIAPRTINHHLRVIYRKMGVGNRVMAALTYDRWLRSTP